MHRPIQDSLEDYLSGRLAGERLEAFERWLAPRPEVRAVVETMRDQSSLLRHLKAETEPSPGFYARVMERIEAQRQSSFWSLFLEPVFFRRLAYASMALFLLLGGVAVSTNPASSLAGAALPEQVMAVHDIEYPPTPGTDVRHDRGVVLATLASWDDARQPSLQFASE